MPPAVMFGGTSIPQEAQGGGWARYPDPPLCADVYTILLPGCYQVQLEFLNLSCQLLDHGCLTDALIDLRPIAYVLGPVCIIQGADSLF